MKTLYDVLGVPGNASDEMIRAAFRKAAMSLHPDHNGGDPAAEQQFRQLVAAYEMLRNSEQRAAYDQYLKNSRREGARGFAVTTVAGLASGVVVALGIWLLIWAMSGSPHAPVLAGASTTQTTRQQMAAIDDSGARYRGHEQSGNRASDENAGPKRRRADWSRHPLQLASNVRLDAGQLEPQVLVEKEWEQVQASGDPLAIWAFAAHNPEAPQSELARAKLLALIDATKDVFLLHLMRVGATGAVAEHAQQRLARLGAVPGGKDERVASRPPSSNSLEERAASFVSSQIYAWSSATAMNLPSLTKVYSDEVLYYGSLKSRQAVILDKRRLLKQRPERTYRVQPDSITVQCYADACKVNGLMDWQTRGTPRTERGTAQFEYGVTFSRGAFTIVSEDRSPVERHAQEAIGR